MRVVSLNTWKAEGDYPKRLHTMVDGLAALSADVIALQEDWRTCDAQMHTARSLADALSMQLTCLAARQKLRAYGQTSFLSTAGLAILSRTPVLEQHTITLPQDNSDGERLAQCVKLSCDGQQGWLINIHLSHLPHRADLRRAQLQTVLDAMEHLAPKEAVVLCGDFNAEPQDEEIASFLHPHGSLIDAFAGVAHKATHYTDQGHPRNLDHIFLRAGSGLPAWTIRHAQVALDRSGRFGVPASDHVAVCVDLSW
jgi:endonuclease/exonuclease/phosphatase family metal-dependent hydrolase